VAALDEHLARLEHLLEVVEMAGHVTDDQRR
jgi:hypothetical protein